MPVLKIKTDNGWAELGSTSSFLGGNADTLDGKHADEFAAAYDVLNLQDLVGDIPVSEQISEAIAQKTQVQIITWEEND